MFEFLNMLGNYEQRKIENTVVGKVEIDTCAVSDSDEPFETGVLSPLYNNKWIIVEMYYTKEDAIQGHKKWVKIMDNPPKELKDVSSCELVKIIKSLNT